MATDGGVLYGFLLVMTRMFACVYLSPILGRKNVPGLVRAGLALSLTLLVFQVDQPRLGAVPLPLELVLLLAREVVIGAAMGFVTQLFLGVVLHAGAMMDMQMGLSMATVYDPQSNISMPLTASLYQVLFFLLLFTTGAFRELIGLVARSGRLLPFGQLGLSPDFYAQILGLFIKTMIIGAKMALPILAVEFILELSVGIIMKMIPQIDVFVLSIILKLLAGLLVIFLLSTPIAGFLDRVIALMLESLQSVLT